MSDNSNLCLVARTHMYDAAIPRERPFDFNEGVGRFFEKKQNSGQGLAITT